MRNLAIFSLALPVLYASPSFGQKAPAAGPGAASPPPASTAPEQAPVDPAAPPPPVAASPDAPPSAVAPGEPAAPPPPPTDLIALEAPPPPQHSTRTFHMHNGFYLRMSLGLGSLSTNVDHDTTTLADYDAGGAALGFDVLIGGTPTPGLAIGGGFLATVGRDSDIDVEGSMQQDQAAQLGLVIIGPFIDGFPNPKKGLHFGGTVGLATLNVERGDEAPDDADHRGGGFGGAVWAGMGGWVGPDWSIGGLLKLSGAVTRREIDGSDQQGRALALSLMFSALYH